MEDFMVLGGTCVWCCKECHTWQIDPYAQEIDGVDKWVWLHDGQCYTELCEEI
jgi:hypothetical protein